MTSHNIVGSEAYLNPSENAPQRDIWAGMIRLVRARRRARSTPSLLVSLAWAIGPSLIGGLLFMAVVGLCAGLVP